MCGIAGFIDKKNTSSIDFLKEMTKSLAHRGPDDFGHFYSNEPKFQIGLGHRRLSVIDLSEAGKQPMSFQNFHIVFNGEIYNYREIKEDLFNIGHHFISESDTEVIVHAYAEWGKECLHRFTGMFAIVIYDDIKKELFCARDRAGIKPFFFYNQNNLFLFASELKAFHKHPYFSKELNPEAVAAFIQFGNVPGDLCIFKNASKLKPGHSLTFSITKSELAVNQYWNVYSAYNQKKLDLPFVEATKETETVLQTAFNYRMVSDVPVGVFLSGGYDSVCVTALLQKNNSKKIKTFTIQVPDIGLDEAPYAKAIARHLGTEHQEFQCSVEEAKNLISDLPYFYDEPFADSSAIPTMLLCKLARKEVTVALSADAGDEVFAGYNRYDYLMKHGKVLNSIPKVVRKSFQELLQLVPAENLPYLRDRYNFANRYEKLKSLLNDPSPENMMFSLSKQFNDNELNQLFVNAVSFPKTAYLSKELQPEFFSPLAFMMAIDYQTYLVDDILQKVDRASMSVGLEAREPFLDHHVIEWSAKLPDSYKYQKGIKKYILKEIVHKYVPKNLMDRPKMGFAIPIEKWLNEDLKNEINYYLSESRIGEQGIFQIKEINNIKLKFFNGKTEYAQKIWYLLMFQLWYEKWME